VCCTERYLFVTDADTVRVWNIHTGECCATRAIEPHRDMTRNKITALSGDGRTFINATRGGVDVWKTRSSSHPLRATHISSDCDDDITYLAISHDGELLAVGFGGFVFGARVALYNTNANERIVTLDKRAIALMSVDLSRDKHTCVLASSYSTHVWSDANDSRSWIFRHVLRHESFTWHVSLSPDGRSMLSQSHSGMISIWNVATGTRTNDFLSNHSSNVVWGADDREILTCTRDHGSIDVRGVDQGRGTAESYLFPTPIILLRRFDTFVVSMDRNRHSIKIWGRPHDRRLSFLMFARSKQPVCGDAASLVLHRIGRAVCVVQLVCELIE